MTQTPALKLNVLIAHPSYGGNGGISSEHPNIRTWEVETVQKMKADPRVGEIFEKTIGDTPITAVRNKFVCLAREIGAHLLLMIDSDQDMLIYKDKPGQKPFWDVAFDEIYNHYGTGPLVVGAPYCGPPPVENVYVFQWGSNQNIGPETRISLDQYSREQAATMGGVQECAALPTGAILYDMRAFELIEPEEGERRGWFYYEWTDKFCSQKASTEDVTNTRDISLAGQSQLGYNPIRCAWDCWVGHWKPWCCGKPVVYTTSEISETFKRAVHRGKAAGEQDIEINNLSNLGVKPEDISWIKDREKLPTASTASVPVDHGYLEEPIESIVKEENGNGHTDEPTLIPFEVPDILKPHIKLNTYFADRNIYSVVHRTTDVHLNALRKIAEKCRPEIIVEVGSWVGESALAILQGCPEDSEIYCMDTFRGTSGDITRELVQLAGGSNKIVEIFKRNIGKRLLGKSVFAQQTTSAVAAMGWGLHCNPKIDLLVIDADHSYEGVLRDIESWLPHMSDGGIMMGHDYKTQQFPGVDLAVHAVFGGIVEEWEVSVEHGGYWCVHMRRYLEEAKE